MEEERLAAELRKIKLQREYLNADKSMMEKKAWKELEAGAERQARDKQNNKLLDQYKVNGIKVKDLTINATNNKSTVQAKIDYDKGYKDRLETRKMENEILHKEVLDYKNTKYAKQKDQEENLKTTTKKRHPFNDKINQTIKANATKKQKQRERTLRKGQMEMDDDEEFDSQMEMEYQDDQNHDNDLLNIDDDMDHHGDKVNKMMEMEA